MNFNWQRRAVWEQMVGESVEVVGSFNYRSCLAGSVVGIEERKGLILTDRESWNFSQCAFGLRCLGIDLDKDWICIM